MNKESSFQWKFRISTSSFEDFKKTLIKEFGVELFGSKSAPPIWAAIWPLFGNYRIEGDYVSMLVQEREEFRTYRDNVDTACTYFIKNLSEIEKVFMVFQDPLEDIEVGESFENLVPHFKLSEPKSKHEDGQLKVLMNAFEVLDSPLANVVVIGGGGPMYAVSGLTYHAIAESTPMSTWTVYEPLDLPLKTSNLEIKAEYFNYDSEEVHTNVTHVIDDAYFTTFQDTSWGDYKVIDTTSDGYVGKVTFIKRAHGVIMKPTPGGHSACGETESRVVGGGNVNKRNKPPMMYGTSDKYGPYDFVSCTKSFPEWLIMRSVMFKNKRQFERLKKKFPNAAITTKAFKDDYGPDVERRTQHYYGGNEERL